MKIMRKYLIINCSFWKSKSSTPYIVELTVFIKVNTEILKEFSKEMPKKVKKEDKKSNDIINITTDKKYLFIISLSKLISENNCLLIETFLGLTWDIRLFKENLKSTYSFINLMPELVEKKDPPIITKIKKIKDKFLGLFSKEKPIFDTLLERLKNNKLKSYSKFKNEKKISIKEIKYINKYRSSWKKLRFLFFKKIKL